MSHFKRSQRKYVKKTYRVRNWHEYEAGLRERGSLTVWISLHDGKLANWDKRSKVETTFYRYKIILGPGNASERVGVTKSRSKDWVQDSKHDDGAGAALQ